tara:strand:- start:402 stop:587 length:186 start_codon:yes stop_codon:yes gene_type:complete
MGAGCSNRNAVAVQDVVKSADINQLTKDAQDHLKAIKQAEGTTNLGKFIHFMINSIVFRLR